MSAQPGILLPKPRAARYLSFSLGPDVTPAASREAVHSLPIDEGCLAGLGAPLVIQWGQTVEGLRTFPSLSGPGVEIPSTQHALWCWLRGENRGELLHGGRMISHQLHEAFRLEQVIDGFKYGDSENGLDLTGYEDGTENPEGEEAARAALVSGQGPGLDGSSFVAVQQWLHQLDTFSAMSQHQRDHIIGRRQSDNEEIEDAPESAHVKRTAQETFSPEAFVMRRSMPWAEGSGEGLMFVAFGHTPDSFEAQLERMAGLEDGVTDALFRFSRPITGGYYWCPPMREGRLDLSAVQD